MKMILKRNESMLSFHQDVDSYIRHVFAHISDKIWITRVYAASSMKPQLTYLQSASPKNQITVEFEPQPSLNPSENLQALIENAVMLRGDLTLVELDLSGSYHHRFEL